MACLSIRVRVHHCEVRQFNYDRSCGQKLKCETLLNKIKDVFQFNSNHNVALYWKDLDDVMIRFDSDEELEIALKERSCFSNNTLNIYLKDKPYCERRRSSTVSEPSLDSFPDHKHEKEPEAKSELSLFNKDPDSVEGVASVSPVSPLSNLLSDTDETVTNRTTFYNIANDTPLASFEAEASIQQASTELLTSAEEVDVSDDDGTRNAGASAYDVTYHNRETATCESAAVGSLEVPSLSSHHNMTSTKSKKKKKKKEYPVQMVHTVETVFPFPNIGTGIGTKLDVESKSVVGIEQTDSGFDSTDSSMIDEQMLEQLRDVISSQNKKPVDVKKDEPVIFDEPVATSLPFQDTELPDIDGAAVEQMKVGKDEYRFDYKEVAKWLELLEKEENDQADGKDLIEETNKAADPEEQSLIGWMMSSTASLFNGLQYSAIFSDRDFETQETQDPDPDHFYIESLREARRNSKKSMAVVEKA